MQRIAILFRDRRARKAGKEDKAVLTSGAGIVINSMHCALNLSTQAVDQDDNIKLARA